MSDSFQQGAGGKAKAPAKDENIRRYGMQREAQKVLAEQTYQHGKKERTYRVTRCHRHPYLRLHNPGVDVVHYADNDCYGYSNLLSCGSTWHCPICSPKITEHRRAELDAAIVEVMRRGGEVAMMTLTYRHSLDLPLGESLDKFYKARAAFTASQAFKAAMCDVGALGRVFATEVTYGENGWHPHLHMLIMCEEKTDRILPNLERLRDYWAKHVMKVGLGQINDHGFDVRNGDYAAEYVAKYGKEPQDFRWSVSHELTKSAVKVAKGNNVSPFGFLDLLAERAVLEIGSRTIGIEDIAGLFREYAIKFQGRQQLAWSPGLRDKLGLDSDRSDEEIAEEEVAREIVGTISSDDWKEVLRVNGRGQVLALVKKMGPAALPKIIDLIPRLKLKHEDEPWFAEEKRFRGY